MTPAAIVAGIYPEITSTAMPANTCVCPHTHSRRPRQATLILEAATLPCAGVTAWRGLVVCGQVKLGDTRRRSLAPVVYPMLALQFAKACRCPRHCDFFL